MIAELRQQKTPLRPGQDVKQVISLLKALDMENLALDDQIRIPIPDNDGIMRAWNEIYYDDLGARAYDIELPTDRWNTHYDIDGKLAEQLGIQTLGSLNLKGYEVDDEDMGEDLTTRINNVLRQYSIDQAFNEFLANASDAGATRFDILIDERPFGVHHLLSPEMAPLQTAPAVIIHNDGVFTESDFKGIRRVGLGGKQDRKDAIGKFGLGALSMFHFTEVCITLRLNLQTSHSRNS